jgi:cyclase
VLRTRVIPVLLLREESLVKTVRFGNFVYVGDPCNTLRIFNELEVDELMVLDITAPTQPRGPNVKLLAEIASECFMPLGYGGGIKTFEQAQAIFDIGFEKISLNSAALEDPKLITRIAKHYGSQAVVVSIDVKTGWFGKKTVWGLGGRKNSGRDAVLWAREAEQCGAGEILLTSIDQEGTWSGFDLDLIRQVSSAVTIPVVAHGGAGSLDDIRSAVKYGGASAVALGSMVVFQKKGMGVLVNFPLSAQLNKALT